MPSSMGGMTSSILMHLASTRTTTHNLTKLMIRAVMIPMEQEVPTMANPRTLEDQRLRLVTTNQRALPTMTKEPLHEPLLGSAYLD